MGVEEDNGEGIEKEKQRDEEAQEKTISEDEEEEEENNEEESDGDNVELSSGYEESSGWQDDVGAPVLTATQMRDEEWQSLKTKSPLEALRLMLSRKASSGQQQTSSTSSASNISENSREALLQELKAKVLDVDLFQTIENDHMASYHIKGLLQKLNTPSSSKFLFGFLLAFEPLLERITFDIQKKRRERVHKEREARLQQEEWAAVEATNAKISSLELQAAQDAKDLAECDAVISKYQEQIKSLQAKISAKEKQKAMIKQRSQTSLESTINVEAASAIEHLEKATQHEAEVQRLTESEAFTNIRLEQSKVLFEKLKANLKANLKL